MKTRQTFRTICGVSVIALGILAGCKKNVAAAPPAPPVQPAAQPAPAPTISLRATPDAVDRGQATSLQWTAKNATTVRIEPELGAVDATGTHSISPASSVTYTATATGPGGTASDAVRVTVRIPAPPTRTPEVRNEPNVSIQALFERNVHDVYFDYDKSTIRPDQIATLQASIEFLKAHPGIKFVIEGHCDDRGSEEYNLGLGDRRANAVKDYLVSQGISATTFNTISYGAERPVCREANEDCYQKNRHAAFVLSPQS